MSANNLDDSLSQIAIELGDSKMLSESEFVERIRHRINTGKFDVRNEHDQKDVLVLVQYLVSPRGYVEAVGGKLPTSLWANLLADAAAKLKASYPSVDWQRNSRV